MILDRNFDLATPLHHTWTYQALVHDVMVREKEGRWEGEEEEEGGRRWGREQEEGRMGVYLVKKNERQELCAPANRDPMVT